MQIHFTYLFPLLSLALLSWMAVCYKPKLACLVFFLTCISFWYAWIQLMGLPNRHPLGFEIEVHAFMLEEPNYIYVWTTGIPPISYRLPWDLEQAKKLTDGVPGVPVFKRNDGEWVLHPKPQEDLPVKKQ